MKRRIHDLDNAHSIPIFAVIVDWTMDENGLLKIFEIQQFSQSVPSELAKLSPRRAHKEFGKLMTHLGIEDCHQEYQIESFGKVDQRSLMAEKNLHAYQPLCCSIDQKSMDASYEKIGTLLEESDKDLFIIKRNLASRGLGNVFIDREALQTLLTQKTLHDILPRTSFSAHYSTYSVEEVVNAQGRTFRSYATYNPENKDYKAINARIYYHAPGSADSHSYKNNGQEDELTSDNHYHFENGQMTDIRQLSPETSFITPVDDQLESVLKTILDDPTHVADRPMATKPFQFVQNKKDYRHSLESQYIDCGLQLMRMIKTIDNPDILALLYPDMKDDALLHTHHQNKRAHDHQSLTDKLSQTRKKSVAGLTDEDRKELTLFAITMIEKYVPILLCDDVREQLDTVSASRKGGKETYYLKKAFGEIMLGKADKDLDFEAYQKHKQAMDQFLLLPIEKNLVEEFLASHPRTSVSGISATEAVDKDQKVFSLP